ncbi:C45 family autoproteolytic acyltransferase/hydolase [Bosea lathyri]|jgi:isopenicillin-N N-acyltransferase-like protein|uniref:Acyl-coenzyme A:6-aminopenicillanic acid acyl-transferase n=1 Tax=Bosea lathyri TaxID=1036778 RepID=A0A1H5ZDG8_9HYPH|nr:C45 family peptidase [Bosea lathyri]SEG33775.1 Acyl-coenzyme A:6-aminopenicillanic acid acyl-transferase [Bosea lathyri]
MVQPCPFVDVSGTPYERGRQHGLAVPQRVKRSIELYGGQLNELGFDAAAKSALIAEFAGEIEAFGAHYVEEMRGIADGAGVALEDIVMVNARTEVMAKARLQTNKPVEAEEELDDGCTGAVILPERSATGELIHGQNWDWKAECAETAIVLRVRRDDGPDFLTFVEAGGLARCGMNAAGVCITANYLESERDFSQTGVPLALIRRKVLEQEHLAFAIKAVATTPKSCSNNMMLSTVKGFAIDFECAPDEAFPIYPSEGLIVHANHWVSPIALTKLRETGTPRVPESFYRDWRVRKLLDEAGGKLTVDDLKQAFFDDFLTPYSVCRPPRLNDTGNLSATVAMVIMQPAKGIMEVAPLPALNRTFTRYSLTEDPVLLAQAAE